MTLEMPMPAQQPDASSRLLAMVAGGMTALSIAWFGLIASHQGAFYDQTCGNVAAHAGEKYAGCILKTFEGAGSGPTEDLRAALTHLEREGFSVGANEDSSAVAVHDGSLLYFGGETMRLWLSVERGALEVTPQKSTD